MKYSSIFIILITVVCTGNLYSMEDESTSSEDGLTPSTSLPTYSEVIAKDTTDKLFEAVKKSDWPTMGKCLKQEGVNITQEKDGKTVLTVLLENRPYQHVHTTALRLLMDHDQGKKLLNKKIYSNEDHTSYITHLEFLIFKIVSSDIQEEVTYCSMLASTLLEYGEDPYMEDNHHTNAIKYAKKNEREDLVKFLQEKRAAYCKTHKLPTPQEPCCTML